VCPSGFSVAVVDYVRTPVRWSKSNRTTHLRGLLRYLGSLSTRETFFEWRHRLHLRGLHKRRLFLHHKSAKLTVPPVHRNEFLKIIGIATDRIRTGLSWRISAQVLKFPEGTTTATPTSTTSRNPPALQRRTAREKSRRTLWVF